MIPEFNGAELRLARIFNGMSLDEVAERVFKSRQYIHQLETGIAAPTEQLRSELATVLSVQKDFLISGHKAAICEDQFHFRKLFTTRAMVKQIAMARGELVARLVYFLEHELKLPEIHIPEISISNGSSNDDVERAAELCRREWNLGLGPIAHMSRLAENVGAIVTSFPSISKEVDALSVAVHRPIIVRNEAKESTCRQRFDIGHELGHFVMHAGLTTGDRVTESQANRFASALLIPRTMMAKLFPRPRGNRLDWLGIQSFKLTWKASKAAILYRARQLELISDDQYKTGVIALRATGQAMREKEDDLIPSESPELLEQSLKVLAEHKNMFADSVAAALKISPMLLDNLIGFSAPMRAMPKARPALYLVN